MFPPLAGKLVSFDPLPAKKAAATSPVKFADEPLIRYEELITVALIVDPDTFPLNVPDEATRFEDKLRPAPEKFPVIV